jgi:DNA-binding beta-propeller fold protein YncE
LDLSLGVADVISRPSPLQAGLLLLAAALALAMPPRASSEDAAVANYRGVIAVDKVGNVIRFLDPLLLLETAQLVPSEKAVHELAISIDRNTAYVPLYGSGVYGANDTPNNKILIVNLQSRQVSGVIDLGSFLAPHGMVATRGGKLWVVCDLANKLLLIDPAARAIEAAYDVPGKGAHFLALLPDESKLYISNKESAAQVFDTRERVFTAAIASGNPAITSGNGSGFEGLAVTPDGRRVVIADNDASALHIIDTSTDLEVARVPLRDIAFTNAKRSRLVKLAFSPNGRWLVATAYATGQAWIVDSRNYANQKTVPVAKGPQGIAFDPDGKSFIVSSHDDGVLTRVDLRTGKPVAVYDGGTGIEVLAFY